jgi:predicted ATP-grasp superfamily ATP-dependent carboligase
VLVRLRVFDFNDPVPELNEPHALAIIQPWINVGSVGSLILSRLEAYLGSKELARLERPGDFFDLTRYRPTLHRKEGRGQIEVPNTIVTYGKREKQHDFLFLRLLEPHMLAEEYVASVLELLKIFHVKRYCLLGAMYDVCPYTRPLLVTGAASTLGLQNVLAAAKVVPSDYQGPTTILYLIGQKVLQLGIETFSLIVHIPSYLTMEEDYRGERRLMEILCSLYDFTMTQADMEKAEEQEEQVSLVAEQMMLQEPRFRLILKQLEDNYDSRLKEGKKEIQLSPEVEQFLNSLDRRFRQG